MPPPQEPPGAGSPRPRLAIGEDLARALFAGSPYSTVIYDSAGHPLEVNRAFERLWGVSLEGVPPDYTVLADPELERQGALPYIRRAFEGETVVTPPVRYDISQVATTGRGRVVWSQGHFYPVCDAGGRLTHVVLTHIDLTDQKEAEEASRAKSEFLAVMSHELRTPLNAIGGYAELIELGIRGPVTDAQREDLHRIQQSQRHLLGLINEVLNYARLEAGAVTYESGEVRIAEMVAAAEALILPQVRSKGLTLEPSSFQDDLAAWADPEKLQQILLNLLSNALKFTEPGGRIGVRAEREGDLVAVRVWDTGIGIPPEKLGTVFEPFVQVGRALNRPSEGAGLGLAISRDLARGMGGDLTGESTFGAGSVFTLLVPRVPVSDG